MAVPRSEAPFPSFTETWHSTTYTALDPTQPHLSQKGKSVLITGGGGSIGAGIAHSFAAAGATSIALLGRNPVPLLAAKTSIENLHPSTTVHTYPVDITSLASVTAAINTFVSSLPGPTPKIDTLISNAGTVDLNPILSSPSSSFGSELSHALSVMVTGATNVLTAFAPHASEEATVVNVGSFASFILAPGCASYAVGKAAAQVLFSVLQLEKPGWRVVTVQPGSVKSEMHDKVGAAVHDEVSLPSDFAVWLAGPDAGFLKGRYVFANWDMEEMVRRSEEILREGLLEIWLQGVERKVFDMQMENGESFVETAKKGLE